MQSVGMGAFLASSTARAFLCPLVLLLAFPAATASRTITRAPTSAGNKHDGYNKKKEKKREDISNLFFSNPGVNCACLPGTLIYMTALKTLHSLRRRRGGGRRRAAAVATVAAAAVARRKERLWTRRARRWSLRTQLTRGIGRQHCVRCLY